MFATWLEELYNIFVDEKFNVIEYGRILDDSRSEQELKKERKKDLKQMIQ